MPHRPEQQLAGAGELAADDDPLGVEQVAEVRGRDADVAAGVRDRADAPRIPGHRLQHDVAQLEAAEVVAEFVQDGRAAGERLEAAAVPAAAERTVLADRRVAELAGDAVIARGRPGRSG